MLTATAVSLMKRLKSEFAALDRIIAQALSQKEIAAELAPKHDEKDGTENKQDQSQQSQSSGKPETISNTDVVQSADTEQGHKPSMVAEPLLRYPLPVSPPRFPSRHAGI